MESYHAVRRENQGWFPCAWGTSSHWDHILNMDIWSICVTFIYDPILSRLLLLFQPFVSPSSSSDCEQSSPATSWCDWSQLLQWDSGRLLWDGCVGPPLPLPLLLATPHQGWSALECPCSPQDNISAVTAQRTGLGCGAALYTGCCGWVEKQDLLGQQEQPFVAQHLQGIIWFWLGLRGFVFRAFRCYWSAAISWKYFQTCR